MKTIEVKKIPNPVTLNLSVVRPGTKIKAVEALPKITYVRPRVVVDAKKVAAYSKVCGFSKGETPITEGAPLSWHNRMAASMSAPSRSGEVGCSKTTKSQVSPRTSSACATASMTEAFELDK